MNFKLVTPCPNCPFRKDIPSYLLPQRVAEIGRDLIANQKTFSCHKTNSHDGEETIETEKSQHCAGALIFLEKLNSPNQMMRIAERMGMYDRHKLDMEAPVFDSLEEMVEASVKDKKPSNKPNLDTIPMKEYQKIEDAFFKIYEELENPVLDVEPSDKVKFLKAWKDCRLCSLSVTDRVEVEGVVYECMHVGWKVTSI